MTWSRRPPVPQSAYATKTRSKPARRRRMRWRTASGMPPGRLCSVAGRQVSVTFGRCRVSVTSSRARAPQPTTRTRGAASGRTGEPRPGASGRDAGTALVDEPSGGLGRDPGIPAIGVGADGHPEFLVQRRPADEDDVVVADLPILEGLDHDL